MFCTSKIILGMSLFRKLVSVKPLKNSGCRFAACKVFLFCGGFGFSNLLVGFVCV